MRDVPPEKLATGRTKQKLLRKCLILGGVFVAALSVTAARLDAQQLPISSDALSKIQQVLQGSPITPTTGQPYSAQQTILQPSTTQIGQLPPSRLEQIMSARAGVTLALFGYDQLSGGQPVTVPQSGAVDDSYVLGPGDLIIVSFRGQQDSDFSTTIDRNGAAVLPHLSPILAGGRTLGDFRQAVTDAVNRSFHATQVFVSVGSLRQITVLVSGEVVSPGQRLVTALSSPLDALLLSGGVKKTGSLRNVKLVRGGKETTIDLYAFLSQHGYAKQINLMGGDRIIVPPLGPTAAITGWVRSPGIYELAPGTRAISVKALTSLAGGLEVRGRYRLSVLRTDTNGVNTMVALNGEAGTVRDSEIIFVQPGAQQTEQSATLSGGTPLAGVYSVGGATHLSQVLKEPGALGQNPYTLFGLVVRHDSATRMQSLLAFTPTAVLSGHQDIDLASRDTVRVFSAHESALLSAVMTAFEQARQLADSQTIAPQYVQPTPVATQSQGSGHPSGKTENENQPNSERQDIAAISQDYLSDGGILQSSSGPSDNQSQAVQQPISASPSMSLSANGLAPGATIPAMSQYSATSGIPSVSSLLSTSNNLPVQAGALSVQQSSTPTLPFSTPTYPSGSMSSNTVLPPNMQRQTVTPGGVPTNQEVRTFGDLAAQLDVDPLVLMHFLLDHQATISGAVLGPGTYLVGPDATLQDLVTGAGGTSNWADQSGVEIISTNVDAAHGVSHTDRQLVAMGTSQLSSYVLRPHDEIRFKQIYSNVGFGSVTIQGQVRYPGTYSVERGEKLSDILLRAGGLTDVAYPYGTVFLRKSAADNERAGYQRAADELENMFLVAMSRVGGDQAQPQSFVSVQDFVNQLRAAPALGRISIIADPTMIAANPDRDSLLENGDVIYVPQRPNTVTVLGQVAQPGSFPFRSGATIEEYIEQAGGPVQFSDDSQTFIVLPDGTARPVDKSWLSLSSPDIPPGATIYVPRDVAPIDTRQIILDVASIFRELALSAASLAVISRRN